MKKNVYNLTPHAINVAGKVEIPSSGKLRLTRATENVETATFTMSTPDGELVEIQGSMFTPWTGYEFDSNKLASVPDSPGDALIVSMPVAEFIMRGNLWPAVAIWVPDTGPQNGLRNERGEIVGTRAFVVYRK